MSEFNNVITISKDMFSDNLGWNILLRGKTKLSGIHINHNIPIEAIIAYHVKESYFIVAALDDSYLKMVKIRVTGKTTFKWISARYNVPSSNSLCKSQRTFNLDCFSGTSMSSNSYNVVLRAEKGTQI